MNDDISIHITVLLTQLWELHVTVTYTNNTSRILFYSLVQLIMSKRIVQMQLSSTSLGQILCDLKNQMLILLSRKSKIFFVSRKSYPGPNLIQFRLKDNYKSK